MLPICEAVCSLFNASKESSLSLQSRGNGVSSAATGEQSGASQPVSSTKPEKNNAALIGGIIAAVILVLLLLLGGLFLFRRSVKKKRTHSVAAQRITHYASGSEKSFESHLAGTTGLQRSLSNQSVLLYQTPNAGGGPGAPRSMQHTNSHRTQDTITEDEGEEELSEGPHHNGATAVPSYSLGVPSSQDQSSESVMRGMVPLNPRPGPKEAQDQNVRLVSLHVASSRYIC